MLQPRWAHAYTSIHKYRRAHTDMPVPHHKLPTFTNTYVLKHIYKGTHTHTGWCSPISHALPQCTHSEANVVRPARPGQGHYMSLVLTGFSTGKRCQECTPPDLIQWQVSLAQKGHVALMTNLAIAKERAFLGTGGSRHCWSKGEKLWSLRGQEGAVERQF